MPSLTVSSYGLLVIKCKVLKQVLSQNCEQIYNPIFFAWYLKLLSVPVINSKKKNKYRNPVAFSESYDERSWLIWVWQAWFLVLITGWLFKRWSNTSKKSFHMMQESNAKRDLSMKELKFSTFFSLACIVILWLSFSASIGQGSLYPAISKSFFFPPPFTKKQDFNVSGLLKTSTLASVFPLCVQ